MHGAGIKTVTTTDKPAARLLDLTRLISRVGRGPMTGVDRVEFAYLQNLLTQDIPLFGLIRSRFGLYLLAKSGCQGLYDRFNGTSPWGRVQAVHLLRRRLPKQRRQAESDVTRLAHAHCKAGALAAMLADHLPTQTQYINVGHSNLSAENLAALASVAQLNIAVMVHDTIPLDFPQHQRPGTPEHFAQKLKSIGQYADLILCNSKQTQRDVQRHLATWGNCPDTLVALLGADLPVSGPYAPPPNMDVSLPYFVTVGTIEPRKNHALLLDVWQDLAQQMAADTPRLYIVGARGWNNQAVFDRLDSQAGPQGPVHEIDGLNDFQMMGLVQGASGFLFPSLAEGFGLPPVEAISLGTPVICGDLPVYRETVDNKPIYLPLNDVYQWSQHIMMLASQGPAVPNSQPRNVKPDDLPNWGSHFNLVLKSV